MGAPSGGGGGAAEELRGAPLLAWTKHMLCRHPRTHTRTHTQTHTHIHTHTYTNKRTHTRARAHIRRHTHKHARNTRTRSPAPQVGPGNVLAGILKRIDKAAEITNVKA
jgi:hypothetical protein